MARLLELAVEGYLCDLLRNLIIELVRNAGLAVNGDEGTVHNRLHHLPSLAT